MPIKQMPKRFSWLWWRLWRSGAIARLPVYLDYMAGELERVQQEDPKGYRLAFALDPDEVRCGARLSSTPRSLLDLGARCRQDLQLSHKICDEAFVRLIGQTAQEAGAKWKA